MVDLSLYAVLDAGHTPPERLPAIAAAAVRGGATLLQLRAKDATTRAQIDLARAILAETGGAVPLLVNDRVDVALAAGADGVHVGHGDIAAEEARAILGPDRIVGLTVHTDAEAAAAPVAAIDYASIGGVFVTTTKRNDHPPIGIEGFARIAGLMRGRRADLPLTAIAGITPERAAALVDAGADGIAVVSAIADAADPEAAARRLVGIVQGAVRRRSEAAAP